jgi:two-component system C4-dicarboxylate transport sensor histidine kinase DctB
MIKKSHSQRTGLASFVLFALFIVGGAYLAGARQAGDSAQESSERQLQIIALDLQSVLERYEALPFALTFHVDAAQALQAHQERSHENGSRAAIARLNLILGAVQRQSKVAAIYLMDASGQTIAASNWDNAQSYIGLNFSFRPYFRDAINGQPGRFYGIGSTTREPGYFIAQPVYATGSALALPSASAGIATTAAGAGASVGRVPIGVIAVKISLLDFASSWSSSEEPIMLVDRGGVVFLSNQSSWQYSSLAPLAPAALQKITDTLQYVGNTILPITALPEAQRKGFGTYVARPVGRLGWQLLLFPSNERVRRIAVLWALAASLLLAIAGISFLAFDQRRARLQERLEARVAARLALQQAADDLDRRISLRTAELTAANRNIETKYVKLKETEKQLRSTQDVLVQAGKLAMLGQMAAGVTHELNQPLTAIRAFSDNAQTFLARGQTDKAGENLVHISAASARMGAIIGQLKGFARKSDADVAMVDLARSIRASALLLESDFKRRNIDLHITIVDPVQVLGNAVRIEQVLINLLRNAQDAVEALPERSVWISLRRDGDSALMTIRDCGAGIPDDVAQHLFEAFFTTKSYGKGLGLGLAISASIVQAMNGRLAAHNHQDGGAEFTFRLPLALAVAA